MTAWTDARTNAHQNVGSALAVVDNLLGYVKDGQGKPFKKERALFAAAVVFTYGPYETFVEQLAIKAAKYPQRSPPIRAPNIVRRSLEKTSAWELTVYQSQFI